MSEIEPKTLFALPFVDGTPDTEQRPDQQSILWVLDGECLGAANYKGDNTGELNRAGVEIQKNVATLYENNGLIDGSLREIIDVVNAHDVALGDIGDDNLANRVNKVEQMILPLGVSVANNAENISLNKDEIDTTNEKIGNRSNLDSSIRTIYDDLLWIKTKLGAAPNQDVSGGSTPGSQPTGIVSDVISNYLRSIDSIRRVDILEQKIIESSTATLDVKITQIRNELGTTDHAPNDTVYTWIENADLKHDSFESRIEKLINDVGDHPETIDDRITANTANIAANNTDIKTNSVDIKNLREWIGGEGNQTSIEFRLHDAETNIGEIQTIIGFSPDDGLRGITTQISSDIGQDSIPESIKGRLVSISSDILDLKQDVVALNSQVGNNTTGEETGIYRDLKNLSVSIHGSETVEGLESKINRLEASIATKIDDAPNDGKMYVRQSGSWVEFTP